MTIQKKAHVKSLFNAYSVLKNKSLLNSSCGAKLNVHLLSRKGRKVERKNQTKRKSGFLSDFYLPTSSAFFKAQIFFASPKHYLTVKEVYPSSVLMIVLCCFFFFSSRFQFASIAFKKQKFQTFIISNMGFVVFLYFQMLLNRLAF